MLKLITRAQTELGFARRKLRKFVKDENGASLIEYTVLIILITAATIGIIVTVGGKVTAGWTTLNTNLP